MSAGFPVEYKNDAFAAYPNISAQLVQLFELRFIPSLERDPRRSRPSARRSSRTWMR